MSESKPSEAQAFLDSVEGEAETSESLTVQELLRQVRTLQRKNDKLRSGEQIIRDAVAIALGGERIRLPPVVDESRGQGHEEIAVLHVSDVQLGKVTSTYNSEIAAERLRLLTEKTLRIVERRRQTATIRDLRIYLGGDIVEGENIFPGQAHLIDDSVFEQACRSAPTAMASLIWNLARHFDTTTVQAVYGNHGRPGSKHAGSHPKTNWDRVAYEACRLMLLGSDEMPQEKARELVTFHIPDTFYAVDRVFDWGNLVVHGHQIRGGFAGFPWYGCVPDDHECLTATGWKKLDELVVGERVLTFDHETHESRWQPIEDLQTYDIDDEVYALQRPGGHEVVFTKDHKWPTISQPSGRRGLLPACDLNAGHWLPVHGSLRQSESVLSPRLAAVLGWIVTDGSARWTGNHWEAVIYQSPRKHLEAICALTGTDPRPARSDGKEDVRCVAVSAEDRAEIVAAGYRDRDDLARIVGGLSAEASTAMFEAMLQAEGSKKGRSESFCQSPGPVAEAFQMLSVLAGRTAWRTIDGEGFARIVPRVGKAVRPSWGSGMAKRRFQGRVWCPSTSAGTWWVRSPSGMVMPTGNTAKKAWGWIDAIDEAWDYLWFGHFHTYASAVLNHRMFLCNGTTESDNDYAREELSACGHPCQRLAFFTEEHGLTADYQVFLTDEGERVPQLSRRAV